MLHIPKKFGIISHARTGSTNLLTCLSFHKEVKKRVLYEPFCPDNFELDFFNSKTDLVNYLKFKMQTKKGFKHLLGQCPIGKSPKNLLDFAFEMLKIKNYNFIFLRRKNLLDCAISMHLAQLFGNWASGSKCLAQPTIINIKDLEVKFLYKKAIEEELELNKSKIKTFYYEDIYLSSKEEKIKNINKILNCLELEEEINQKMIDWLELKLKINKNFDFIKNINEINNFFMEKYNICLN